MVRVIVRGCVAIGDEEEAVRADLQVDDVIVWHVRVLVWSCGVVSG